MPLDVPSEYESILRQAVASGRFASESEALEHALQLFAEQLDSSPIAQMPDHINIEELSKSQGVAPFKADAPRPTVWAAGESTDEFLAFLRDSRQESNGAHR